MIIDCIVESCKERMKRNGKGHYFTGERDVKLSMEDLSARITRLHAPLLNTLSIEMNVFKRNDLIRTFNGMAFIPDWDVFITQLDSFYEVSISPPEET